MRSAKPVLPLRAPPRINTCAVIANLRFGVNARRGDWSPCGPRASRGICPLKSIAIPLPSLPFRLYGPPAPKGGTSRQIGGFRVARYYLGVDGGGTNCRIRLTDESLVTLADAQGGRSNLQIDNGEPAFRSISEGAKEVFAKAGIDFTETKNTYACFG